MGSDEAYCQPCVSPVWDTALACQTLFDVGSRPAMNGADAGLNWCGRSRCSTSRGIDRAAAGRARRRLAFQYANAHYPDLDDTAVIVMAMDRAQKASGGASFQTAIERGREWTAGLQSRNGGWGAFDADNNCAYLNNIPFSDHGALLDPPTEDLTGAASPCSRSSGRRPRPPRRYAMASRFSVDRSARTEAGTADGA